MCHDVVSKDNSAFCSDNQCDIGLNPSLGSSDWKAKALSNAFVSAREPMPAYIEDEDGGEEREPGCET